MTCSPAVRYGVNRLDREVAFHVHNLETAPIALGPAYSFALPASRSTEAVSVSGYMPCHNSEYDAAGFNGVLPPRALNAHRTSPPACSLVSIMLFPGVKRFIPGVAFTVCLGYPPELFSGSCPLWSPHPYPDRRTRALFTGSATSWGYLRRPP